MVAGTTDSRAVSSYRSNRNKRMLTPPPARTILNRRTVMVRLYSNRHNRIDDSLERRLVDRNPGGYRRRMLCRAVASRHAMADARQLSVQY